MDWQFIGLDLELKNLLFSNYQSFMSNAIYIKHLTMAKSNYANTVEKSVMVYCIG